VIDPQIIHGDVTIAQNGDTVLGEDEDEDDLVEVGVPRRSQR